MSWAYVALSLLLVPLLVATIDVVAAVRARFVAPRPLTTSSFDVFSVLVPIWGSTEYLENVDYLATYGDRVILCTTTSESIAFNAELGRIASAHGFRIYRGDVSTAAKRGERDTGGTTRDRLVRGALHTVDRPYVVCIDADTITRRPLGELVEEMRLRGLDLASVPLRPANDEESWLARLQAHEYRVAMSLRRIAPWLVSGGCHAGRTAALRDIMDRHSLFFQGNDVETGVLGVSLGYRVGHVAFDVPTSVPARLRPWLRQRFAWAGGEFRLFIINFRLIRRHPLFWGYGIAVVFAALPLRWYNVVTFPRALLGVGAVYLALMVYINWRTRNRWLLLMPIYVVVNSLLLTAIALPSYVWMAIRSRNAGIIRYKRSRPAARHALNPKSRTDISSTSSARADADSPGHDASNVVTVPLAVWLSGASERDDRARHANARAN